LADRNSIDANQSGSGDAVVRVRGTILGQSDEPPATGSLQTVGSARRELSHVAARQ
jgi:hypothetical protein